MKPEEHEEIYRVAFESAGSELTEIEAALERLRSRKDHIEKLVAVLKPLVVEEEAASQAVPAASQTLEPQAPATENTGEQKSEETSLQPEAVAADPFQRRIDHVLGIGAGIRDVRKYSRQF